MKNLKITVLYDNYPSRQGLETGWGFSCLVEGGKKTILFDTGGDGAVLLANMRGLGIDPSIVDIVVLSHGHGDHSGGLEQFLAVNRGITVLLLRSFPETFKKMLSRWAVNFIMVSGFKKICEQVYATGEIGGPIPEQTLLVRSAQGLVVITGCAHPGIVKIIHEAKRLMQTDAVLLAMGGFHLLDRGRKELEQLIADFKQAGVLSVGPCHCSGDLTRRLFAEYYGNHFIDVGVGKEIRAEMLL